MVTYGDVNLGYFVIPFIVASIDFVQTLIPLLVGIAVLFFVYRLTISLLYTDNNEKRQEARQQMVWGIIALFVLVSVWGLVNILSSLFNLPQVTSKTPYVEKR